MPTSQQSTPATGLKGLVENWRNDLVAAVSVALVALPLALGIAVASGVPPMAGVMSAVVAGLVTTFIRGSHIAINGPANSLIAVILAAVVWMDDGSGRTFNYVLGAIVVSGAIQAVLGMLRLGRLAEIFPSSVIHGILAAIGIIIVAKQLHVALGTSSDGKHTVSILMDVFRSIEHANPYVAIISVVGMFLLIFHARISYKLFHFLPAPIWVLMLAIPFAFAFNYFEPHELPFFGRNYHVGPELLVNIPSNPLNSIVHPDFSKINTGSFWLAVISITLIATLETLTSTKAVDKLDPYKRKTNLNKDLIGVGLSTMVSGALGGLPIVTVIIRSTVNVHNNAKTSWSNFFHGVFLLVFVVVLSPVIQMVPLAALAVILVFSGFKLAHPRVFAHSYEQGMEQLVFMVGTLVITLYTNLLVGIFCGIVLTLGVHLLLARLPVPVFFQLMFKPGTRLDKKKDGSYELKIKGITNFFYILRLNKLLEKVPAGANLKVNVSTARLVDLTVLEQIEDFKRLHQLTGGRVTYTGIEHHVASTTHPLALKSQTTPIPQRLSPRQHDMKRLAVENDWLYRPEIEWDTFYLQNYQFFESRPVEYKTNVISGEYKEAEISWELSDITFDEGALIATEVYHTTVQVIELPFDIPQFSLESEGLLEKIFDRVKAFPKYRDIDFKSFVQFSSNFQLRGENEDAIRKFITPELVAYLESNETYHIESDGGTLLIFKALRFAKINEINKMLEFSEKLVDHIVNSHNNDDGHQ